MRKCCAAKKEITFRVFYFFFELKLNFDSVPFLSLLKFSLCFHVIIRTQTVISATVCHGVCKIIRTIGQSSIAITVERDIYFVVKSRTHITAVAKRPTRQSGTQTVERQTRKPLPPLKRYHTGYICPSMAKNPVCAAPKQ